MLVHLALLRLQKSPNNKRGRPTWLGVCVCVSDTVLAVYRWTVVVLLRKWSLPVSRVILFVFNLDRLEKRGVPQDLTNILRFGKSLAKMRLQCIGKWRYLKGFSLLYFGMEIRQSVHVFTMLSTRLSMFTNQTFPRSSDLVLQTLDDLQARPCSVFGTTTRVLRIIRCQDVLSGNTPSSSAKVSCMNRQVLACKMSVTLLDLLEYSLQDWFAMSR